MELGEILAEHELRIRALEKALEKAVTWNAQIYGVEGVKAILAEIPCPPPTHPKR